VPTATLEASALKREPDVDGENGSLGHKFSLKPPAAATR
jgi:hypothetical protein